MAKITIDGKIYEARSGKNLLETCQALGFDIPYFCHHPALGSVGACRLCAVKKYMNAEDTRGRIVMSCMEPVVDGLIVSLEDVEVKSFRANVLEGLMTNHPHDCPVCDEGGECHLQDMTVKTGHSHRRFEFKKRTYKNQNLGPFINHEMNRCIQCYKCVRFYKDYAGGKDLAPFASHNHVSFGRFKDGALESEFSGNLVEVCPTGVFTDKTLKQHFSRKWDLTNAPSICTHCSVGCNLIVSERYGVLRRVMSRYHGAVNGYFICDRGRFGYEYVNSEERIKTVYARVSKDASLQAIDQSTLFKLLADSLKNKHIVGIGSPRASIEANYALSTLVGDANFFHGIAESSFLNTKKAVSILESGIAHSPSLKEMEKADVVFILGEDLTNTAPMMALAIRQATRNKSIENAGKLGVPAWNDAAVREMAQNDRNDLFIATTSIDKLDELAAKTYRAAPDDIARLGFAVAAFIDNKAPIVELNEELKLLAMQIATSLKEAKNPLIISGLTTDNKFVIEAASNIALALNTEDKKANLSFVFPESNSVGLALMKGNSLDAVLALANEKTIDTLVILENDLYRRQNKAAIDLLLSRSKYVIVLDTMKNATAEKADLLLPVGTFAESQGTIVNNEGRAQRYYNVFPVEEPLVENWRWLTILQNQLNSFFNRKHFDIIVEEVTNAYSIFATIKNLVPKEEVGIENEKIARQTPRFSGRTAMNANIAVSEQKPPVDEDSQLAFTMEGSKEHPDSALIPYYWSPGLNSNQAVTKYLTNPNGSLKGGDPGILLFNNEASDLGYFKSIPEAFKPIAGEYLVVPIKQIFGSEELSSKAKALSERIVESFALLNEDEISSLGLLEGDLLNISSMGELVKLKLKAENGFPKGVIGITDGMSGQPFICLASSIKIEN